MGFQRPLSRRDFLKGVALGGAGVMLAGCGSSPAAPATTGEPAATMAPGGDVTSVAAAPSGDVIQLDIWTGWTEAAAKNIESILNGYNESQTRIVAKHVVVPEAMDQKLLAAIAAGNPPGGAIVFGANTAYQLAAQDALLPLDNIGSADQVATLKSWMAPALWDLGIYNGKLVFASMWNQCWGIFVNNAIAEQQGVDVNAPPANLDELDAVWDKLTITNSNGNIDVLGGDLTWTAMIMGRFLGQYVSEDGKTITANHPNNLRALEWMANRWQRIGPDKMQDFYASLQGRGERSAGQDPFLSGLIATSTTGPWVFDTMAKYKPADFEFTVWPLPTPANESKKGMYTYGDGWVIPKDATSPEAVWEIISAMTGAGGDRDVYTSLFTTWQCVNGPVSEQITEDATFRANVIDKCPGYEQVFLKDLFESDQYLYPPKIPTSSSYASLMDAEWEKVRLGQKQPQEALDFVTETAQQELDTWLQQQGG
jgi:multiple sugar transport system substrate-binding protein